MISFLFGSCSPGKSSSWIICCWVCRGLCFIFGLNLSLSWLIEFFKAPLPYLTITCGLVRVSCILNFLVSVFFKFFSSFSVFWISVVKFVIIVLQNVTTSFTNANEYCSFLYQLFKKSSSWLTVVGLSSSSNPFGIMFSEMQHMRNKWWLLYLLPLSCKRLSLNASYSTFF